MAQSIQNQKTGNRNVVVTGFGLFRGHQLNTSWEAIKDERLKVDRDVVLVTKQIAVSYEEVNRVVSQLWTEYKPILMVHIGLAAHESSIRVEQLARHGPYILDDVNTFAPHKHLHSQQTKEEGKNLEENLIPNDYSCEPCSFSSSETCFDVDLICEKMMKAYDEAKVKLATVKSRAAGLYLCEYIYYKSLEHSNRTVFVHVPDMIKYPLEDITECLKLLIELFIDEVDQAEKMSAKRDDGHERNSTNL